MEDNLIIPKYTRCQNISLLQNMSKRIVASRGTCLREVEKKVTKRHLLNVRNKESFICILGWWSRGLGRNRVVDESQNYSFQQLSSNNVAVLTPSNNAPLLPHYHRNNRTRVLLKARHSWGTIYGCGWMGFSLLSPYARKTRLCLLG